MIYCHSYWFFSASIPWLNYIRASGGVTSIGLTPLPVFEALHTPTSTLIFGKNFQKENFWMSSFGTKQTFKQNLTGAVLCQLFWKSNFYCGVFPHFDAVFTTSTTLSAYAWQRLTFSDDARRRKSWSSNDSWQANTGMHTKLNKRKIIVRIFSP